MKTIQVPSCPYFKHDPPENIIENEIGKQNLYDLEKIRRIILIEEDRPLKPKEVLTRVLAHYKKAVKYE